MPTLIEEPTLIDVVSVSIDGIEFAVDDPDTSDGFDFTKDGLTVDPSASDIFVNIDRDGDGVVDESIGVTPTLVGDTFVFDLDIV